MRKIQFLGFDEARVAKKDCYWIVILLLSHNYGKLHEIETGTRSVGWFCLCGEINTS